MSTVHYSHITDEWETPPSVFQAAQELFGVHLLDVAAQAHNAKVAAFSSDSLHIPWSQHNWCNPPFSLADAFVNKAIDELDKDNSTTLLLKAAPETVRFKQLRQAGVTIIFLSPRVHYLGAGKSCPFPSCFVRLDPHDAFKERVLWYDYTTQQLY